MVKSRGRITAQGMLREGTPVEYYPEYDLYVKREDLACLPPGPPFSKTRGVYAHVRSRPEKVIGVLDTVHSQAGHAVARACQILGKVCINFYPVRKSDEEKVLRLPQQRAAELGAEPYGLKAGMSAVLWYQARKLIEAEGGYMMPNALKLEESVEETAREVSILAHDLLHKLDHILVPISSGTIAAGVIKGIAEYWVQNELITPTPRLVLHMGYSRPKGEILKYLTSFSGTISAVKILSKILSELQLIDEGYKYKNEARLGPTPPWPCNIYYDLKAFRWLMKHRSEYNGTVLMWNIG